MCDGAGRGVRNVQRKKVFLPSLNMNIRQEWIAIKRGEIDIAAHV